MTELQWFASVILPAIVVLLGWGAMKLSEKYDKPPSH